MIVLSFVPSPLAAASRGKSCSFAPTAASEGDPFLVVAPPSLDQRHRERSFCKRLRA